MCFEKLNCFRVRPRSLSERSEAELGECGAELNSVRVGVRFWSDHIGSLPILNL